MILSSGQALASAVDATKVLVIRAPADPVVVTCGGAEMFDAKTGSGSGNADAAQQEGTQLGKRYVHPALGLELLCTASGAGTLAADGVPLTVKDAKPLPASD